MRRNVRIVLGDNNTGDALGARVTVDNVVWMAAVVLVRNCCDGKGG